LRTGIILPAFLGCVFLGAAAHAQACAGEGFLCGPPLTFTQVREAIGIIYAGRLQEAIHNRGVSFAVTERELDALARAGAPDSVLAELKRASAPAESKTVPPKPEMSAAEKLAAGVLQAASVRLGIQQSRGAITVGGRIRVDGVSSWNFAAHLLPDGTLLRVDLEAGGPRSIAFERCAPDPGAVSGIMAPELERALRLFCVFQPAAVVAAAVQARPVAEGPFLSAVREWIVRASGADGSYEFAFSRDFLPVELKYAAAQPGGTAEVAYAGYLPLGSVSPAAATQAPVYPGRISIRLSEPPGRTIDYFVDGLTPAVRP
jgi:hypothetical protein